MFREKEQRCLLTFNEIETVIRAKSKRFKNKEPLYKALYIFSVYITLFVQYRVSLSILV